jgi:hypothetical protein
VCVCVCVCVCACLCDVFVCLDPLFVTPWYAPEGDVWNFVVSTRKEKCDKDNGKYKYYKCNQSKLATILQV